MLHVSDLVECLDLGKIIFSNNDTLIFNNPPLYMTMCIFKALEAYFVQYDCLSAYIQMIH